VLSVPWIRDGVPPQSLSLTQILYGERDQVNNLLRGGGVYLLGLSYFDDEWGIHADRDVQFEIDDQGLIWSHSEYEGFNRFDGQEANVLTQAIIEQTSDENFAVAMTRLGRFLPRSVTADVTVVRVVSSNHSIIAWDFEDVILWEYVLTIDEVIIAAQLVPAIQVGDELTCAWYGETGLFEPDGRYLVISPHYQGNIHLGPHSIALVNDDDTIRMLSALPQYDPGDNVFIDQDGCTLAQIRRQIQGALSWYQAYTDDQKNMPRA